MEIYEKKEKHEKKDIMFKAKDGNYYPTMDDVESANKIYWDERMPFIINNGDTIFNDPLIQPEEDNPKFAKR